MNKTLSELIEGAEYANTLHDLYRMLGKDAMAFLTPKAHVRLAKLIADVPALVDGERCEQCGELLEEQMTVIDGFAESNGFWCPRSHHEMK